MSTESQTTVSPSPRVKGPRVFPFMGSNTSIVKFFGDPIGIMQALYKDYGLIAAVRNGDPSLVCAFGAEHNRRFLSDQSQYHNFAEFPYPVPAASSLNRLNQSLTNMNDDLHRRQRKLMMPAFSKATIQSYRDDMVAITEERLANWHPGIITDVSSEMLELTLDIAMQCLFGLKVGAQARNLGHAGMHLLQGMTSLQVMMFPFNVPGTPYARLLKLGVDLEGMLRTLIKTRRQDTEEKKDVLSLLINSHDEEGTGLTDDELVGQTNLLFLAGHETTAYTLVFTLFLLSQHPEIYAKLLQELDSELHGTAPTLEQLDKLPYLDSVVKESMRLIPAAPFMFIRKGVKDFDLGPYPLPEGSKIVLSPLITHRMPEVFPDGDRFMPERWNSIKPTIYEYLPFGAGPRMCIGAGFAAQEIRIVLAIMVQKFKMSMAENMNLSYMVRGITLGPKYGMAMNIAHQDGHFERRKAVKGNINELVDFG